MFHGFLLTATRGARGWILGVVFVDMIAEGEDVVYELDKGYPMPIVAG